MKRILIMILVVVGVGATLSAQRYDIREEARFLTDKMAYELNLDQTQYIDVFEINFDFISSYQPLLRGMNYGSSSAIRSYNNLLAYRDANLRYVLSPYQYNRYTGRDYFYRPLYRRSNVWSLSIYVHYNNRRHYYYNAPHNYHSYHGNYRYGSGHRYHYRNKYDKHHHRGRENNHQHYRNNNSSHNNGNRGHKNNRSDYREYNRNNGRHNGSASSWNTTNNRGRYTEGKRNTSNSSSSRSRSTSPKDLNKRGDRSDVRQNRSSRGSGKQSTNNTSSSRSYNGQGRSHRDNR